MENGVKTEKPKNRGKSDFIDLYHAKRRREILKAHPELRELINRPDPSLKYVIVACVITQLAIAYFLRNQPIGFILTMAVFAGTLFDCTLENAVHESVHEFAIACSPLANKVINCFINFALVLPFVGEFHYTHRYHHSYLGTDLDPKYPTMEEAMKYDMSIWGRLKYIFTHPLQGGPRWARITAGTDSENPYSTWNARTVWVVDILILYFWGYKSLLYLMVSYWINDCVLIQGSKNYEDHQVTETTTITKSYYGLLNFINFNIGYHREHHDLPTVTGRYMPLITKTAKEFYQDERYISKSLFTAVWDMLMAKPGKGLTVHANKLNLKQVEVE